MYVTMRRFGEAEPLALAAYEAYRDSFGVDAARTRETAARVAQLYEAWGKPTQAAEWRAKLTNEPPPIRR
jgi:hypothetical protein